MDKPVDMNSLVSDGREHLELDEFIRFFYAQTERWVLWLGSSISIELPSAVPGVPAILSVLMSELGHGLEPGRRAVAPLLDEARHALGHGGASSLQALGVPFEVVLGQVSDHTGAFVSRYLQQITPRTARPNPNHGAAAALALGTTSVAPRVRLIVTTNFGECIEGAAGGRLSVWVPQEGAFQVPPGSPALLKLHGTISDPPSLGTTPAALARRDSADWRGSLVACLGTSNVLVVGYSFSDIFDITPALRDAADNGARFFWACRPGEEHRELPVRIAGTVRHDLADGDQNVLRRLVPAAAQGFDAPKGFGLADQIAVAESGCEVAVAAASVPASMKLAAFGALFYWIEQGEEAVRYFIASAGCSNTHVTADVLARAFARARRFRAAVRLFDRMLAVDLPPTEPDRTTTAINWCIGAGFCAATGGRPVRASHYYRRARREFNRAKHSGLLDEQHLGPYLADQLLRSQAAYETRLGVWHGGSDRERHLARATRYLDRLESIGGLELATRPLLDLDRARIELARGNPNAALVLLRRAEQRIDPLRDPHVRSVCRRLIAVASRDRNSLRILAAEARQAGRWIEWAKIQAERFGLTGYGRGATLANAARCLALATLDFAKDLRRPVD